MSETEQIMQVIDAAEKIVIIQADNPDGDSLGSAVALENILSDLGKEVYMYCGVDMPSYLSYIKGWDRVSPELPNQFDASIIVDNSSMTLLDTLEKNGHKGWVAAKPCVVLDHHRVEETIPFASVVYSTDAVATCELIYELSLEFGWKVSTEASEALVAGIMSDSLGLTSQGTSARSIEVLAALVKHGANISKLDAKRKEYMKKNLELTRYKGQLLQRVEVLAGGQVAIVTIPWEEIQKYSPLFNPPMLVMEDMRMIKGVKVAIAFKHYQDGKVTGKIRCNQDVVIARKLAEKFGGGGHDYAAGFKVTDGRTLNEVKKAVLESCVELLK